MKTTKIGTSWMNHQAKNRNHALMMLSYSIFFPNEDHQRKERKTENIEPDFLRLSSSEELKDRKKKDHAMENLAAG